jgi:AcrR family transcriptional regulator
MERTGRPRDPHIDGAVLDAVAEVLARVGYARLTLEEVAKRARTTKPAIYRRWSRCQDLVLAALERQLAADAMTVPDSGCVVCDLGDGVRVFLTAYERMPPGVLGALYADCAGMPALRAAFVTTLFTPPRRVVGDVVDRAKARGDLRADLDPDLAVDLVGSFVFYRAMFGHAPTDEATVEAAVVTVLRGVAADFAELSRRKLGHKHNLE